MPIQPYRARSMRQSMVLAALHALAIGLVLTALPASADTAKDKEAVKGGIETCGKALNNIPTEAMASLIADLKAEAARTQPQKPPEKSPKSNTPAEAAAAVRAPAPVARVIAQAEEQAKFVEAYKQQATVALRQAEQASDPRVAAVYLKDAMSKTDQARRIQARFMEMVDPSMRSPGGDQRPPPDARGEQRRLGLAAESDALRQLVKSAGLGQKYEGRLGFGENAGWNEGADPVELRPQTNVLMMPSGAAINLQPLEGALRQVAPQAVAAPMFKPVPPPTAGATGGQALSPSAPLLKALADPAIRDRLDQVGGVALKVTLDLLQFSGVPAFRDGPLSTVVDQPILLSLSELYREVQRHAASAEGWEALPEKLRYPAGIERIFGFVIDVPHGDILLVGERARDSSARIDIDDLIVGLRTVWLDGKEPAVSLDALPNAPAGDQYATYLNVPDDSHFAQIMVQADYAMKQVSFGKVAVAVPGFRNFVQAYGGRPQRAEGQTYDRQWLSPQPLGLGDVRLSSTGRTMLFDTAVRAQTERMLRAGLNAAGTGQGADVDVEVAKSFTKAYPAFEQSEAIQPRRIFLRLHGLTDIVTATQMMRRFDIALDILKRFAALPIRELTGVPSQLPAVIVPYATETTSDGRTRTHAIAGGVQLRARASRRSLDRYRDVANATLEAEADNFPRGRSIAVTVPITLAMSRGAATTADQAFDVGYLALSSSDWAAALEYLKQATQIDPQYADAWAYLALAYAATQQAEAATKAISTALRLEPEEEMFQQIALVIQLAAGAGQFDPGAWSEQTKQEQSLEYSLRAQLAAINGREDEALSLSERALDLWQDNADAWYVHAELGQQTLDQAIHDYDMAIRLYRKRMSQADNKMGAKKLAFALAASAYYRAVTVERTGIHQVLKDPDEVQAALGRLGESVDLAGEASTIDPTLPFAPAAEVYARGLRALILQSTRQPFDYGPARRLGEKTVRQFPDFALGHVVYAHVLALMDDLPAAITEMRRAADISPTTEGALITLTGLEVLAGQCSAARRDLARAVDLGIDVDPELKQMVEQCR